VSTTRADFGARYVQIGLVLVPLPPLSKAPTQPNWQHDANLITSVERARAHWRRYPNNNIGMCLEPSRLVSVDADNLDGARHILAAERIDLDALIARTATIVGRNPRLEFRAPATTLSRKAIA
jgi:hypothetical protein